MDSFIDKLFFPSKLTETSLIRKFSGSQSFLKSNSMFPNMLADYQYELLENTVYSSDFDLSKAPKLNLHSLFKAFSNNLLLPNLSPGATLIQEYMRLFSSPVHKIEDMNLDFSKLYVGPTPYQTTMKSPDCSESRSKATVKDQVAVSLTECTPLVGKTHLNMTVTTKKVTKPLNVVKKDINTDCNLNNQMVIRKTKELQKRSKKRRKRQKRGSTNSNPKTNSKEKLASSPNLSSKDSNKNVCDIFCDVTIMPDSNSLQIVLPKVSSFVVSIESGEDDDSDWDTASSNADDDSEFQICGLFVTSFTTTQFCRSLLTASSHEIPEDLNVSESNLKKLNKNWNNIMKEIEGKMKSPQLVSFAPDEELIEICPVDMFDRKGEWEIYATERLRFKRRINEMEAILSPCLSPVHRAKIYHNLYQAIL